MTKEDTIYQCQLCDKYFRSTDEGVHSSSIVDNDETKVGLCCPKCQSTNIKLRGTIDRIITNS